MAGVKVQMCLGYQRGGVEVITMAIESERGICYSCLTLSHKYLCLVEANYRTCGNQHQISQHKMLHNHETGTCVAQDGGHI